ncbi:DsbA family protein [Aestuariicoccus sp. MJ-SS9]|uniref:DsbA family protein n=1 Tax=Aestuariicoccus sp. MJ-SS9 TaxID=3079855 RepID=UPI002911D858|nr:DsbA family protein [Aestuariicoccus sp. MJ-SS9]MDU8911294.1 DsbA family protein [Aestuariicoccus sp. MJ-SS9]
MRYTAPLTAAALALTLASGPAQAFDAEAMTDDQRAAFGEEVRRYLMENPEVIIEAVNALEARQAQAQAQADVQLVTDNAEAIFDDGYSWVGGNPEGDITIVEFTDYRCGYCRRAHPEVEELVASDGNIRLILKEFPILGEASVISSRFAMATRMVAGDAAYKDVHDALITLNGDPTDTALTRIAETLGLDAGAIMAEMESDEITRQLADIRALAQALRINGTPTFVMGEELVRGYVPLDGMREIVAEQRSVN